ncbi:hypothetical protein ABEF93_006038 [Exophiala dermatitidis]
MADPNVIGPQPDAGRIVHHIHGIAEEFTKLSNVPALAEGNAVAQLAAQMNAQFAQMNAQMNAQFARINDRFAQIDDRFAQMNTHFSQRFDQLDNKIDTLTTRVIANDHNASARVQNSFLTRSSDRLTPLMNPSTNNFIEWFPAKSGDIPNMEDQRIDSVLHALGLPTNGRIEAKEQRLRQYIGLRPRPTAA